MRKLKGLVIGGLILIGALVYCVSPIDFAPGPIDDILVLILGTAFSVAKIKD